MRLIVAGGRDFNNYDVLKEETRSIVDNNDFVEVVCGMARGADTLGEKWAKECGYPIKYFPANWDLYGKSAGYIRNEEMAKYATHLIAFWDGKSRGTKHMIDLARKHKLYVKVINY